MDLRRSQDVVRRSQEVFRRPQEVLGRDQELPRKFLDVQKKIQKVIECILNSKIDRLASSDFLECCESY